MIHGVLGPLALALLLIVGCAQNEPAPAAAAAGPLTSSVQAEVRGGGVRFVLQVTNTTGAPLVLNFRSGQSYDFVVRRAGQEVWRWSADQMFTQALRTQTLAAGETLTYEATWTPPAGASGEHEVTGVLTAQEHRVEQTARFRLP